MSPPLLRLAVRLKNFPGAAEPVLRDVAMSVGEREIVALLGPSGCGKTTLLRLVAGLDPAFDGTLIWAGGAQPRVGMVFQAPLLLPWRTVRQNLRLVLPEPGQQAGAEALLAEVGLTQAADLLPAKLSLGMARRVAIVRALAIAPRLLLLDEPFVSLDPAVAVQARAVVLTAWRARPTAILLVTHDAAEAAAMADRVLLLSRNPGRIAAELIVPEAERRAGHPASVAAIARAQALAAA